MIGRIYRLMDTKRIEMKQREIDFNGDIVLVKPDYMTICAADQRYYLGRRKPEILKKKLPMALIHEATGVVLRDFGGRYPEGTKVVLVPLEPAGGKSAVKENYRQESKYASSGEDGFMRDLVALPSDRVIPIDGEYYITYVFSEVLSVALGAVSAFEAARRTPADVFGIWGDGGMGYVTALAIHCRYPDAKIFVFGKTSRKLQKFSFTSRTFYIDQTPRDIAVNHAFECVGSTGSEDAINQIVDIIDPQGVVSLIGVSEEPVSINTRRILEKGLAIIGNNRSDGNDFKEAVALIKNSDICQKYLRMMISDIVEVKKESDISYAFEQDLLNDFKTVIKWAI